MVGGSVSILPAVIAVVPLREKHLGVYPRWAVLFMAPSVGGQGTRIEVTMTKRLQPEIVGDDEYRARMAAMRTLYPRATLTVRDEEIESGDDLMR